MSASVPDRAGHEPSHSTLSRPFGDHPSREFTPGPWQWFPSVSKEQPVVIDTAIGVDSTNGTIIAEVTRGKQFEANAHLISAAPDLYEALRQCRLELRYCADQLAADGQTGHPEDSVSRALRSGEAALAKARGETA
jgi:hypothetical protein